MILYKNDKEKGIITLSYYRPFTCFSFIEYLTSGIEISYISAIDYTASNGEMNVPQTLHYLHDTEPNQYEISVYSIGKVLEAYNTNKSYRIYGYGAEILKQKKSIALFSPHF